MTESNLQALVIQKVDNPIHWINLNPVDSVVGNSIILIHWIMIYSVYCAIKHLNNRGQNYNVNAMDKRTSLIVRSSHVKDRCSS